ncbi:amidohydrolase [Defluviimonas salinarum]|uniref:Amidohydrolase n=1 Tax=Defluviimonas salinarum TaxID=2992147 RepID=A0ABT3IZX6_9RHOB|nr:amidohydrolase [Defluviimonas salinarum]MCW3780975.1 amidohydrolase [Defluviimonas salinarum]
MSATIFTGGPILTMDAANSTPEAVGIAGERIVAVGPLPDVRVALPGAREIDLAGRTLIPAFIDPHGHFPDSAFVTLLRADLASPPRGGCRTLADIFARLRAKAAETPKGDWVMGAALDETLLTEGRMPTRDELDAVSSDHPIWVIHTSGHCGVANSLALARHGVGEDTPDPAGGRYLRDAGGRLTGGIEGLSAMGEMGDTHFLIDASNFRRCFDVAREEYISHGVTLAQNSWTAQPLLDLFAEVAAAGDPGIDLVLLPIAEIEPDFSTKGLGTRWPEQAHVTLGPRKLLTDGSFLMRTAWLTEPYHTGAPGKAPDTGLPYMDRETLFAEVRKLHDLGFQIHTHCNGDAASDLFLDAVEAATAANPRPDHRHTIIHGQVMRQDQLARCAALGVTISFFPAHVWFWGDKHHDELLGPERAANISPAAWAEAAGVRFTIHNDASVTPTRPLQLIHTVVNRRTQSGRLLGDHQRVSALSALRAHTIDAAWQVFQEAERGSIETGKLADLAVLDANPLAKPENIENVQLVQTWRRGLPIFAAEIGEINTTKRIGAGA